MHGCTIKLWYNKQRVKKNGDVSLYLQVIYNSESAEIKLKIDWPVDKFDWVKRELRPRFKGDTEIVTVNASIERERSKYWKVVMDYLKEDYNFTLGELFKRVNLSASGQKLAVYMDYMIKARQRSVDLDARIKPDTARSHNTTIKWIKEFTNDKDVHLVQINSQWLRKFANYLRGRMCENTVWVRIKTIKTYLAIAHRQRIPVNLDYRLFTIKMDEPDPVWLDESEIAKLLEAYNDPKISLTSKRNLKAFLFACFTGLRISDLARWNKSWIKDGFITFVPIKRRLSRIQAKPISIPIIPIAQGFINQLEGETFDLPAEQVYNRELKVIAENAGINKRVTSHVARHTFATWLAIDQVPVLVISSLLGHRSTKTTMIYIHIAEQYKAVQMLVLQRRFQPKPIEDVTN